MLDLFRRGDVMLIFYKKMLRNQGCVLFACVFLMIFNGWLFFHNFSVIIVTAFGAFICNTLWSLLFYFELYSDYKIEKHRNALMKELEDKHELEKNIQFLKDKQKQYDSMISMMQAKNESVL